MDARLHPGMCGCCEPAAPATPLAIFNRPGLSAIAYRIGTFSSFREAMLEAIAREPALAGLTTRRSDDSAITLLELWAVVADVLTFYQERIANEAYLRTARERDSVLRLVRLLDYQLRPGLAATALLAFTLEEGATVKIPVGLRVQSTPGQDEVPQIFETVEAITADARLDRIAVGPKPDGTKKALSSGGSFALLGSGEPVQDFPPGTKVVLFDPQSFLAPEEKAVAEVRAEGDRVRLTWNAPIQTAWETAGPEARAFLRRMKVFGHDAPENFPYAVMVKFKNQDFDAPSWKTGTVPNAVSTSDGLPLDTVYKDLGTGDELLVHEDGKRPWIGTVTQVTEAEEILGTLDPGAIGDNRPRGKVTKVGLSPFNQISNRHKVTVYQLQGSALPVWNAELAARLTSEPLYVPAVQHDDGSYEIGRILEGGEITPGVRIRPEEIDEGRTVLLADAENRPVVAQIAGPARVDRVDGQDFLVLDVTSPSPIDLKTASAVLLGNVVRASHGETVRDEIVGSGDATVPFQKLALAKSPLTYLPSPSAARGESALRVLANGEAWREVASLYGQPPTAQVYTARQEDDGTTVLQFGDGVTGARLPTGQGNVAATYRHGSGLEGRVRAGQLDTPLDVPVGLDSVINPTAAEGGADPEVRDRARDNAPVTVRTFGRAVSLRDFEWLALESGLVAKASATWVWRGFEKGVHLTVAGQRGETFSAETLKSLHSALTRQRDPNHPLVLANVCRVPLEIEAVLRVDGRVLRKAVERAARGALRDALAFDRLAFAQPLHLSDVYRILQEVPGVIAVDVNVFHFQGRTGPPAWAPAAYLARGADARPVQEHVRIFPARPSSGSAAADPFVARCFPAGAPEILPAEQAFVAVESRDLRLTFEGGLA
jgi:uncharacterized phage protein gp47/JayE